MVVFARLAAGDEDHRKAFDAKKGGEGASSEWHYIKPYFVFLLKTESRSRKCSFCVKNNPLLTNFLSSVFAAAVRKSQADIRRACQQLVTQSPSGLGVLFEDVLPSCWRAKIDPTKRIAESKRVEP